MAGGSQTPGIFGEHQGIFGDGRRRRRRRPPRAWRRKMCRARCLFLPPPRVPPWGFVTSSSLMVIIIHHHHQNGPCSVVRWLFLLSSLVLQSRMPRIIVCCSCGCCCGCTYCVSPDVLALQAILGDGGALGVPEVDESHIAVFLLKHKARESQQHKFEQQERGTQRQKKRKRQGDNRRES